MLAISASNAPPACMHACLHACLPLSESLKDSRPSHVLKPCLGALEYRYEVFAATRSGTGLQDCEIWGRESRGDAAAWVRRRRRRLRRLRFFDAPPCLPGRHLLPSAYACCLLLLSCASCSCPHHSSAPTSSSPAFAPDLLHLPAVPILWFSGAIQQR